MEMEEEIIKRIKMDLEGFSELSNISSYLNIEGSPTIKFDYNGDTYIINIDMLME